MAWTTMHFAVGMCGGGAVAAVGGALLRRPIRSIRGWLPLAMTAGGVWALVPDLPRIWREDFPSLPLASVLGSKGLERWLHGIGDLFFFHARLDAQPRELALHGLVLILLLYNAAAVLNLVLDRRKPLSLAERAWLAHRPHLPAPRPARPEAGVGKTAVLSRPPLKDGQNGRMGVAPDGAA